VSRSALRAGALIVAAALAALLFWPEAPPKATGAWLTRAGLTPHFETIEGLRVRYVRGGAGSPVILVHGLASSIYTWRHVWSALAADHDVVALDLPGFGGSEQPRDLSAEVLPRVVRGLADRLGIRRAALVGHSLGGCVAVMLAAEEQDRITRLALLDPAGFNLAPADLPWLLRVAGSPAGRVLEVLPARRALVRLGLRQVFHDDSKLGPEDVEEYWAPLARPRALAATRSLLRSGAGVTAERFHSLAARVAAPTLLVWGRQDAWIPMTWAERFTRAIPSARLEILDACGHMPQEEQPETLAGLLREFLG
jgi:pimeloyl-ACP methyl ester carboxylesterase